MIHVKDSKAWMALQPMLKNNEIKNWVILWILSEAYNVLVCFFNPLMLTVAKNSLTISMIFCRQKQSQENIWLKNINQNITYNSPSNIL